MSLSKRLINTGGASTGPRITFDFIVTNGEGTAGQVRSINVTDPANTSIVTTNTQNKYSYIIGNTPAIYSTTGSNDRLIVSGNGGYFIFDIDLSTGVLSNWVGLGVWRDNNNTLQQDVSYLTYIPTVSKLVRHRDAQGWYNDWNGSQITHIGSSSFRTPTDTTSRLDTNDTNIGNSFVDSINNILFVQNDNDYSIARFSPPTGIRADRLPATFDNLGNSRKYIEADPYKKVAYVSSTGQGVSKVKSWDYTNNASQMVGLQIFVFPVNSAPNLMKLDVLNQVLYVIQGSTQITAIDVSDSSNMSYLGSFTDATNLVGAKDILIDNVKKVAYVKTTTSAKLLSLDISNPSNMTLISSIAAGAASRITPIMPYILP